MQTLVTFLVKNKNFILWLFRFGYIGIVFLMIFGTWVIVVENELYEFTNEIAKRAGQMSLFLFCLVLLPGICLRLRINHQLIGLTMLFRRQIGVTVFLLAVLHGWIVSIAPRILLGSQNFTLIFFEFLGTLAVLLMLPMWLTSNNLTVKALGKWWKRIHSVIYVVAWFIFGHVALQGEWKLAFLVGLFAVLEIVSWLFFWRIQQSRIRKF